MNEMSFLYPLNGLFFIVVVVIMLLIVVGNHKKHTILKHFNMHFNGRFQRIRFITILMGLICIVLALMGPVNEIGTREVEVDGLDIYVLLDTSKSMLAEDVLPSRIERAKTIVNELLNELNNDRIGFIPYSESAYIQMPLTDDYDLARMFLEVVDTDMISGGGSDVAKGITLAMSSFDTASKGDKVIIILSDGEENETDVRKVVSGIDDDRLKIYTIGIGTVEGGLIPEYSVDGSSKIGFKKDENGEIIVSKLDANLLKEIAVGTGGEYYSSTTTSDEIQSLIMAMDQLEKGQGKVEEVKEYAHLYQYFLRTGLLLLLLTMTVFNRRLEYE